MIRTIISSRWIVLLLACFLLRPCLVVADQRTDPLQRYRDEISQAETTATETVLGQLGTNVNAAQNPDAETGAGPVKPGFTSPSTSTDKAFVPPTGATNQATPSSKSPPSNPWSAPNPWAESSQANPWANVPVPGPGPATPPTRSATGTSDATSIQGSPPNIFAPPPSDASHSPHSPNKTTNSGNATAFH